MREVVLVPTYLRPEMLYCCLRRIRNIEPTIPIFIFPDRGSFPDAELEPIKKEFSKNVRWNFVPDHDYHGNTFNVMEAFRVVYNEGWEMILYVEDDVMIHDDFFTWHREQFEEVPELFASMGWVFNRHAPLADDVLYQPWYYAIGTCFPRRSLEKIVKHASPKYYGDMPGYIASAFPASTLNVPFAIQHFEQDGLIQRVLNEARGTTASPGIAKCDHIGFFGYNQGWENHDDIFRNCESFAERVARLEEFIADPQWRASVFDREIVEREIGHKLPKIENRYRITMPGNFETEFRSELPIKKLPKRINSVDLGPYATIENVGLPSTET